MNELHDVILSQPLPGPALRALLFFTFFLHLALVLLMLGSLTIGVADYLRHRVERRRGRVPPPDPGAAAAEEGPPGKRLLRRFFAYKSLAIVLGIGPLLLMQVDRPIPFVTATALFAPAWMLIVPLLIAGLLLVESAAEKREASRWPLPWLAAAGLACVAVVPGIFALMVVTTERPDAWPVIVGPEPRLPAFLTWHWLARWLHVLGAGVLVAAGYHLLRGRRHPGLAGWLRAAAAFQAFSGVALLLTLPRPPELAIALLLVVGALAAGWLALPWAVPAPGGRRGFLRTGGAVLLALTAMLGARQLLQDRILLPLGDRLQVAARAYQGRIDAERPAALASYAGYLAVPYSGELTLYERTCGFCHGAVADGRGEEADALRVPPEDIAALRTSSRTLRRVLREGVTGTAMPYFVMYTDDELDQVERFLLRAGMRHRPEPPPWPIAAPQAVAARRTWAGTCAVCHGPDGRGTPLARRFTPPPPDLARLTFSPERILAVITDGYPGTNMPAFGRELPLGERRALAAHVLTLYDGP